MKLFEKLDLNGEIKKSDDNQLVINSVIFNKKFTLEKDTERHIPG